MRFVSPFGSRQSAREEPFADMFDLGVGRERSGSVFGHLIGSCCGPDRWPGLSWCRLSLRLRLLRLPGTRLSDALIDVRRELGEVLDEQVDQLCCRAVVIGGVGPGPARIEDR